MESLYSTQLCASELAAPTAAPPYRTIRLWQVLKFVTKLQGAARARGDSVFSTDELVTFVAAMKDLKVSSPMELIEVSAGSAPLAMLPRLRSARRG